jgi:protein-tyrosine phosphatase
MNLDEFDACLIYSYDDGTPFMYLGSCGDAKHSKLTDKYKITHVLNVTEEIDNFHINIVYKKIEIEDNPRTDIQNHFEDAHSFLKQAYDSKATVLVHCQAGITISSI